MPEDKKETKENNTSKKKKSAGKHLSKEKNKNQKKNNIKSKTNNKNQKNIKGKNKQNSAINEQNQSKHEKKKTKQELRAEKKAKKEIKDKIILISIIILGSLFAIYLAGCVLFFYVCFPNTVVAEVDLSFKPPSAMKEDLSNNPGNYELNISGYGMNYTLHGSEIDYNFDADQVVDNVEKLKNSFIWPYEIFQTHDFMDDSIIRFSKEKTAALISPEVNNHNATAILPENASLLFNSSTNTFSIKQEVIGNSVNEQVLIQTCFGCVGSGKRTYEITSKELILPTMYSSDERCSVALDVANTMTKSNFTLIMSTTPIANLNVNN